MPHPTRLTWPDAPAGEKLDYRACEALEEVFKRLQFKVVDLEQTSLDEDVSHGVPGGDPSGRHPGSHCSGPAEGRDTVASKCLAGSGLVPPRLL